MKTRTRKNLKKYSKKRNMSKKRYSKKRNMSKKGYSKKRYSKKRYSKKRNNLKGGEISKEKFLKEMLEPKKEDEGAMDSAIFKFDQIKENPNRTSFLEDKKKIQQKLRNLKFKQVDEKEDMENRRKMFLKKDKENRRKMFLNKIKDEESNKLISEYLEDMDDAEFEDSKGCTQFDKKSECLEPCIWDNNRGCMNP